MIEGTVLGGEIEPMPVEPQVPETGNLLVLGVGNVLMGDEGVGIHAVRALANVFPEGDATLVDGGTGGFTLLPLFQRYETIIILDATMDGQTPGTVTVREPRFASDYPRSLSAHDLGLRDLVETSALLQYHPKVFLVTITVATIQPVMLELSPDIAASIPRVRVSVARIIEQQKLKGVHSQAEGQKGL